MHYDDGEKEFLDMSTEPWKLTTTVSANSCTTSSSISLVRTERDNLTSMLQNFGNKPFLKHEAQGFDQLLLSNSYKTEEESFMKTFRHVPIQYVPQYGNIISSHTLYKVKRNEDGSLLLKARIAPHGNEDDLKNVLSKDCSTCPLTGLRIVESIAALHGRTIYKADVKAAFLQTGEAYRNAYVRPPGESKMKSTHLWLPLTAAYGLVDANAKWQKQSDDVMFKLGLSWSNYISQLFYKSEAGKMVLVVAKIVGDLIGAAIGQNVSDIH